MTVLIVSVAAVIPCVFALGWVVGHAVGKADGFAEHEDWCRRRCANEK